jgi:hypothetical protein
VSPSPPHMIDLSFAATGEGSRHRPPNVPTQQSSGNWGCSYVLLLLIAFVFPGLLIGVMLAMEHVERKLGRGLLTDQVEWMLRSELPIDQVETRVAERLVAPLSGVAEGRD